MAGELRKVAFFVMTLPYSDAIFRQVFERITTEVMWEAHCRAFEFFGGVPWRITYDNEKGFSLWRPRGALKQTGNALVSRNRGLPFRA